MLNGEVIRLDGALRMAAAVDGALPYISVAPTKMLLVRATSPR